MAVSRLLRPGGRLSGGDCATPAGCGFTSGWGRTFVLLHPPATTPVDGDHDPHGKVGGNGRGTQGLDRLLVGGAGQYRNFGAEQNSYRGLSGRRIGKAGDQGARRRHGGAGIGVGPPADGRLYPHGGVLHQPDQPRGDAECPQPALPVFSRHPPGPRQLSNRRLYPLAGGVEVGRHSRPGDQAGRPGVYLVAGRRPGHAPVS